MGKKYTADTFEGAVTGTASGNVAKSGDTMSGNLTIQNLSGTPEYIARSYGKSKLTFKRASLAGADVVSSIECSAGIEYVFDEKVKIEGGDLELFGSGTNKVNNANVEIYKGANNEVNGKLKVNYNGYPNDNLEIAYQDPATDNKINLYGEHTYFTKPLRIGANAEANELDDYEEGSFTPSFTNSGGLGITYYSQFGQYVKTGRQVTCWGFISVNALPYSNSNGTVGIDGLPFNANFLSDQLGLIGNFDDDWGQDPSDFKIRKAGSNNDLIIFKEGGSGNNPVNMTGNYLASSTVCNFSITYYTTS